MEEIRTNKVGFLPLKGWPDWCENVNVKCLTRMYKGHKSH
jgi:hypothetical protein